MPLQTVKHDQITLKEGIELPLEFVLDVNKVLYIFNIKLKIPILIPQSSDSSLPTAPPTVKKSAIRTPHKSITLPESPFDSIIKMDDAPDALLDDSHTGDPLDAFSFQSLTGDTSITEEPGQGPSFMVYLKH